MDLTGLTRMSVEPPGDSTVYRQLVDAMILGKAMIVVGILTLCCAVTEMCFFDQLGWLPLEGGWVDYWTAILVRNGPDNNAIRFQIKRNNNKRNIQSRWLPAIVNTLN